MGRVLTALNPKLLQSFPRPTRLRRRKVARLLARKRHCCRLYSYSMPNHGTIAPLPRRCWYFLPTTKPRDIILNGILNIICRILNSFLSTLFSILATITQPATHSPNSNTALPPPHSPSHSQSSANTGDPPACAWHNLGSPIQSRNAFCLLGLLIHLSTQSTAHQ